MAAVSCPAPDFKARKLCVHPNANPTAALWKPLISRSFQAERQKAADGHFGALSIKVTAEDKPRKEHDLGITLGRGETHGICDALGRKIPLRRDFHGDCPDHQRRAPAAAPASRSKPSAMARK
jgi:hypothetical protein